MKTLKKTVDGKVEYVRVKDDEVGLKVSSGYTLCPKLEYKIAEKGYVMGGKEKRVEKIEKGDLREKIGKVKKGKKEEVVEPVMGVVNKASDNLLDGIITQEMKESRKEWAKKKGINLRK